MKKLNFVGFSKHEKLTKLVQMKNSYELPLEYDNVNPYTPHGKTNRVLILGSSSEMSRTLAPVLSKTHTLIGVDTRPVHVSGVFKNCESRY